MEVPLFGAEPHLNNSQLDPICVVYGGSLCLYDVVTFVLGVNVVESGKGAKHRRSPCTKLRFCINDGDPPTSFYL